MPVGIIKGALARLGFQATVTSEITLLPQCTHQPLFTASDDIDYNLDVPRYIPAEATQGHIIQHYLHR
jgi:Transport protein particle (TRAPP) component